MHFRWTWLVLLAAAAALGQNSTSESQNSSQIPPLAPPHERVGELRVARAVRAGTPRIDGVFDAEWRRATPADRFIQRRPTEGAPESRPTRAYVLYDNDAIDVCFVCNDTPDSISARVLRRDNSENCDLVGVYLDSFHDRRNCYYFAVTAAGTQIDGLVSNETAQDPSWDGIWQSAVGRTDSGWVAEIRIPFSAFRHGGARADGWGFNLVRSINRHNEGLFWQPVNNQRGLRVNEFGTLQGLENIGSSRHLEVLPHAVAKFHAPMDRDWKSQNKWEDLGFYAKYVPGGLWTVDATYQPDFAQVDVDEEVINITDYPIFLTEKRPFFLEVGNFFDTSPIQLLYTRRITDPDYVGRMYQTSEKFRGMVLGGQNRTEDGFVQAVMAGRAVLNAGKQSSIGLTGTFLQQVEGRLIPGPNLNVYTGGIDARIRWGTENRWTLAGTGVDRNTFYDVRSPIETVRRKADAQPFEFRSALDLDLHPLPLKMNLVDDYRGQDYNINDLGWGSFSNTLEHNLWIGNVWQNKKGPLQSWMLDLNGWQRNLPDGRFGEGGGQINLTFQSKANYYLGTGKDWGIQNHRKYQALDTSVAGEFRDNFFESLGRFDIKPHYYQSEWVWFETDERRWLSFYTEGSYGLFREGHKYVWNNSVTLKPYANLETSLALDWTHIRGVNEPGFNYGEPTTYRVGRWVMRYSPTLNLSFRTTLQYDKDALRDAFGNYSKDGLLTNVLLAYNWRPGSWFYLVYDESNRLAEPLAYRREGDRTVQAKLTWFFRVK